MNKIMKNPRLIRSIILGVFVVVFFLNLAILRLPFSGSSTTGSLWSLAADIASGGDAIFPFALKIAFYVSLVPIALSVLDLILKKSVGNFVTIFYFLAYEVSFIVYRTFYNQLSVGAVVISFVNLILVMVAYAGLAHSNAVSQTEQTEATEALPEEAKKPAVGILVTDIFAIVVLLLATLFVPLYGIESTGGAQRLCTFASVLFAKTPVLEDTIYFIANLALFLIVSMFFISALTYYRGDKKKFVRMSKNLMVFEVLVGVEFFLLGYIISFVYAIQGITTAITIAFIPLIAVSLVALVFSVFKGRFDGAVGSPNVFKKSERKANMKFEPLLFVLLFTVVTVASLFTNVIDVTVTGNGVNEVVKLTGIELLRDYAGLGSGYQAIAFIVMCMLICSGMALVLTIAGYLAGYKKYAKIAKVSAYVNLAFIFAFGISSLYFTIALEITKESTKDVFTYYGVAYDESLAYKVRTGTIYCLIADVVLLIAMMARKSLDASNAALINAEGEGGSNGSKPSAAIDEGNPIGFDPCPAFTELDSKIPSFKEDLAAREKLAVGTTSLSDLVQFVVNYAKDSRLHLSYSNESIATFIAGLGACRLTILQGMSGTGKTSLPKIFSEAIDGNCDIIEVESSWKDKNELLGFYNEFSSTFTPKKFTQALYKAALNPEIATFIVLDEMNLSRIEYYFSDFLSLMENEEGKRELKLLNIKLAVKEEGGKEKEYEALEEGHTIKVPSNVWFIGTANRDESTFVISDKVYDRAHTMNFNKRAPKVRDFGDPIPQRYYSYKTIADLFVSAKKKGTFDAENDEMIKKTEAILAPFNISFGNRILVQIEDFVNIYQECFPGRDVRAEAVETILLSKVVAKLEVKTIDDKEGLVKEFEDLNMKRCADFINKLNED
jgi:hypothetical protein